MKSNFEKRMQALEKKSTGHIATLADYVLWCARGRKGDVVIASPLREVLLDFVERRLEA